MKESKKERIDKKNLEYYAVLETARYLVVNGLQDAKATEKFEIERSYLDKKEELFIKYCKRKYKKESRIRHIEVSFDKIFGDKFLHNKEYIEDIFPQIENNYLTSINNERDIAHTVNRLLYRLRAIKREIEAIKNEEEEVKVDYHTTGTYHDYSSTYVEERPKTVEERPKTVEEINREETEKQSSEIASHIINGPKNNGLLGKDNNIDDIPYLYAFAKDVLLMMMADQPVETKYKGYENIDITTMDSPIDLYNLNSIIYKKYGVSNIDGLLRKYSQIRDAYYKKYEKLSTEAKSKYPYSRMRLSFRNKASIEYFDKDDIDKVFEKEGFSFPPSKAKLTEMMNRRILLAENYKDWPIPRNEENNYSADYDNAEKYEKAKKYYENLAKNMSVQQIIELYNNAKWIIDTRFAPYNRENPNFIQLWKDILQKMFLEIIIVREGKKYSDLNQLQQMYKEIAKKYFDEELRFGFIGAKDLSPEEREERTKTIQQEYLLYYAKCTQRKEKPMKFTEFAARYYNIYDIQEPAGLSEEIKGLK